MTTWKEYKDFYKTEPEPEKVAMTPTSVVKAAISVPTISFKKTKVQKTFSVEKTEKVVMTPTSVLKAAISIPTSSFKKTISQVQMSFSVEKTDPEPEKVAIEGHIYSDTIPVQEIRDKLSKIHGHLVHFPTNFLANVDLKDDSVLNLKNLIPYLYT